ncbi:hypothetical protein ABIE45_000950 [Methylobacterium sp. OAE515]|uniref:DUF3761 domain-containing protein n=1 Tax=Methylobacterium sp. OAE515 TaxID=2817895 RepID=UPI001A071AFC
MKFRLVTFALLGAGILVHAPAALARECKLFTPDELKGGTYSNRDGCVVPRPEHAKGPGCSKPQDATAHCRDGDWSFSQHRQGTCSRHGGVGCWVSASNSCCP